MKTGGAAPAAGIFLQHALFSHFVLAVALEAAFGIGVALQPHGDAGVRLGALPNASNKARIHLESSPHFRQM